MENRPHVQVRDLFRSLPLLLSLLFAACSSSEEKAVLEPLYPLLDTALLQEGDLIFRLGLGLESQAVVSADRSGQYSHVGLLVREAGAWRVLHAVPGEAEDTDGEEILKNDPLPLFLRPDRAVSLCVMRYDTTAEALEAVCRKGRQLHARRIPFDHAYDITDSSRMYCTEFVVFVFKSIGVDLPEGRAHSYPLLRGRLVLPVDVARNHRLHEVLSL